MQTLRVNGYDMAYLDIGSGPPLVCVHGSLCDFRNWSPVLGPLSTRHRVISVSLRHFFPGRWDGSGQTYSLAQHIEDVTAFIAQLDVGAVDLMGHSRGGHVCFRVAQRRADLLGKLILAEPGGEIDATLDPDYTHAPWPMAGPISAAADAIAKGDVDGGLEIFLGALQVPWKRLPAAAKQLLRDNATTLIGDARDERIPFSRSDAESIKVPTLFVGGANTKGLLPKVLHALAAHVPDSRTEMIASATHAMFEQAPQAFSRIVLDFLEA